MQASLWNQGANGYDGWTTWTCSGTWRLSANVTLNPFYTNAFATLKKQAIWTHEFGHGLGASHTGTSSDIMWSSPAYVYNNYGYYWPTSIAVSQMNTLY